MNRRTPFGLIAPWRFELFVVILVFVGGLVRVWLGWAESFMLGFDLAAIGFMFALIPLLCGKLPEANEMREAARRNDANRLLLLLITAVVSMAVLVAVAFELSAVGENPQPIIPPVPLAIVTLSLAWLFSNLIYALHYAHLFYTKSAEGGDVGGLIFKETSEPDYWDFVYFSFILGMTFQTSDVDITTRHIRRVVLFHSLAAFVFNLGILGFTINVLGSLRMASSGG